MLELRSEAKAIQTRPEPENPTKPPDADPNRRSSRLMAGFRSQKPTPAGRVVGLHL